MNDKKCKRIRKMVKMMGLSHHVIGKVALKRGGTSYHTSPFRRQVKNYKTFLRRCHPNASLKESVFSLQQEAH